MHTLSPYSWILDRLREPYQLSVLIRLLHLPHRRCRRRISSQCTTGLTSRTLTSLSRRHVPAVQRLRVSWSGLRRARLKQQEISWIWLNSISITGDQYYHRQVAVWYSIIWSDWTETESPPSLKLNRPTIHICTSPSGMFPCSYWSPFCFPMATHTLLAFLLSFSHATTHRPWSHQLFSFLIICCFSYRLCNCFEPDLAWSCL